MELSIPYLLVIALLLFFAWRWLKFRALRARLPELLEQGAVIVDVRTPAEYQAACNPRSINLPLDQLEQRASELDAARPVVVCCASGARSAVAARMLTAKGFRTVLNAGPWTNTVV